jgi:sugar O-acyltransferase (sialic acid O-acetyltransferase NeuD family)
VSQEILIYGAGGAGRGLAFGLSLNENPDAPFKVAGFIDDTKPAGEIINDIPVLGGIDYAMNYSGAVAVSIVDNPSVRRNLILKIKKNQNIKFPVVLSPKNTVSPYVVWGEGCVVLPFNFIQPNINFGSFIWVNGGNRIGHDVNIGAYTTIFSGILIAGGVSIGSGCVIGSGAIIMPKRKIGDGSIIGAGTLVSKDIPCGVVAAGNPGKIVREINN